MDIKRVIAIIALGLLTVACSSVQNRPVIVATQYADSNIKLAEAANTVSQSMTDVDEVKRASTPPLAMRPLPDPDSYNMDTLASVDWAGPVGPLVEKIAAASNYRVQVLGNEPAIPVLIQINARNEPLGYILRDADFQCASKANIVVFPATRVIELRYARF